jgi:hypothetical protein
MRYIPTNQKTSKNDDFLITERLATQTNSVVVWVWAITFPQNQNWLKKDLVRGSSDNRCEKQSISKSLGKSRFPKRGEQSENVSSTEEN